MADLLASCQEGAIDGDANAATYTRRGGGARTVWLNSMAQAMYEACNQVGGDGDLCKELLFDVVVRSITGRHASNIRGWEIKSPDGRVYKFSNEIYTSDSGSGGVVIRDVKNSRIIISDLAGRDITNVSAPGAETQAHESED